MTRKSIQLCRELKEREFDTRETLQLLQGYQFRFWSWGANGFTNFKPAVKSSPFDINGTCVYFQDDGLGNIMIITDEVTNPQIINPTAGTIDYDKGEVKLTNFQVETFTGSAIKVTAKTVDNDVVAPKGRVFILRDTDVKVVLTLDEFVAPVSVNSTSY